MNDCQSLDRGSRRAEEGATKARKQASAASGAPLLWSRQGELEEAMHREIRQLQAVDVEAARLHEWCPRKPSRAKMATTRKGRAKATAGLMRLGGCCPGVRYVLVMTMPPSPQSPGPYGPAQPSNPYGGPQYAPQPLQQQYPVQPHPGYAGWGQPPVGPPQRKNRPWKVIGIVAVAVVAVGVIRVATEATARTSGVGFPKAEYRLTVPKTLLGGEFELAQDLSQTQGKEALKGSYDSKIRNPQPAAGQYTSGSPEQPSVLVFSGMYGQFKDPAGARKKMLGGAADADGATVAVPARDIMPLGSGITLSCQVLTYKDKGSGATSTLPMCAWADENTGASVGLITPETAQQAPGSVDLDKIAVTTLKIRTEARQPIA